LHPFVYQELARWLGSVRGSVVFVEGTRWSQGASLQGWQGVLFVDAPEAIRLQRVRSRNPETADLLWSLSARLPWDELRQTSDSCLINDSDLPNLRAQVEQWLKEKGIKIPQART
jgi:dephospho-CoA kinase